MEEHVSWKGHSLTLVIFGGIIALCSIFFILGMLVGRAQEQKILTAAAASKPASTIEAKEEKPELTFFESVDKNDSGTLEPPPPPSPGKQEAQAEAEAPSPDQDVINYQIGAVRRSLDAEKLLGELKEKGFKGFILAPPAGEPNPFYRVQVGPFADVVEAATMKRKLESAGYQPILKK